MSTKNHPPTPETLEQQRLTAVHAFSLVALGFNGWIASPGAQEDVGWDFHAVQQGSEHPSTDPTEWRRNLAAMRIMQTLVYSVDQLQPVVLLPEIAVAEDLYRETDEVIEEVGLNRIPTYDIQVLGPPIRCFLEDVPPTNNVETVLQQVRHNRGNVVREVTTIDEMVEAMENTPEEETLEGITILENGMLAEIHKIPESPTRAEEMPYYQQYVSSSGGAEDYLKAFLEDTRWVSNQF